MILLKKGIKKEREGILQQHKLSLYPIVLNLYKFDLLGLKVYPHQNLLSVFDCHLIQFQLLSHSLGPSSSTHSLQIYCTGLIGPRSHTSWAWAPKTCPYNYYYSCLLPVFNLVCSECKKHMVVAFPREDPFSIIVPAGFEISKVCFRYTN